MMWKGEGRLGKYRCIGIVRADSIEEAARALAVCEPKAVWVRVWQKRWWSFPWFA